MLYFVVTPIGNLGDMTYRAVETLKKSDLILCEDTRHSKILLSSYGVEAPVMSYEKFSEVKKADYIIDKLKEGKTISLITDAGTPVISDPGSYLTRRLKEEKLDFSLVGSGCAAISALVLSGMDASSFSFAGFLPEKKADRDRLLDKFAKVESTLIFYVSPHNLIEDLAALFDKLGSRKACLVREISKVHEEATDFILGSVPESLTIKGEMVLVVEGYAGLGADLSKLTVKEHFLKYIESGMEEKDALKAVAKDRGVSKSEIYAEIKGANKS